jgi:NAD(P)-dependent dehydrogenase (short-subunit alcohol dehydrogenase family)
MDTGKPDLSGRVAIVSGAGKGLGRAYALHLAACGARVVVNNRVRDGQPNSAYAVAAEIEAAGGIALANYDAAQAPETGERLVADALQAFGQLDMVVANAGFDVPCSFQKQDMAEFGTIFEVNFQGTARLLHAAWPHLREADCGRAVVSTSSAGLYGNHGQAAYAASKAALLGLTRSLAIECGSSALRINALAPYAVTPLTRPWFPEADAERFTPEAVARLVAWLVSSDCTLQGEVLIAGGGGVRRAQVLESETVRLEGQDVSAVVASLAALPASLKPGHASEEFTMFADSLREP